MATIRLIHFILQFGSLSARPFQMHPPKRSRRPPPLPARPQGFVLELAALVCFASPLLPWSVGVQWPAPSQQAVVFLGS